MINTAIQDSDIAHRRLPAPIRSGIRWTLWLSILAVPFGYGTNILLARIGPEALGTFGVLNVYIGLVFALLFLGGCAVPMKFLPEVDVHQRGAFVLSYAIVVLLGLVPWLALCAWKPHLLSVMFGNAGNPSLQLRLLYLSPICVAYLLLITSLKGLLDMKWAQLLDRSINVGQMLVLLVIFVANQRWLKQHSAEVVWLSYVGLCCIVSIGAFYRLRAIGGLAGHLGLWLPARFWTYTLMLQANSMLGLLGGRLDYILIINTGGIRVLGQYVAVMAIASIIPRLSGFVVDSLLPSLTTCLAAGDTEAAGHVASTYLRVMFVAVFTLSVSIVLLARPALAVMGPEYLALTRLAQVAIIGAATQSLSLYTNVYFTATDCVRDSIFSTTTRIVAFGSSFWALWPVMGLAGAVLSWVIGELAYHVTSLYLIVRRPRLGLRLLRSYAGLTTAAAFSAVPSYVGAEGNYIGGALLLIPAALSFYLIAGYSAAEIREIVALLTPECIRRSNAQRQGAF